MTLETNLTSLSTGLFGGSNLALNRFIGPGRVGFQSMALHQPVEK